jgi:hypothetical protein
VLDDAVVDDDDAPMKSLEDPMNLPCVKRYVLQVS